MSTRTQVARYSTAEEIANSITHGVGLLLAMAGLATLVAFAVLRGTAWHIVGCSIFGATLVLSYLTSTLYHSIPSARAKSILRIFDHCAIFLLIAGTYTPLMLVNLRGPWGWSILGVVWGIATLGIVFKVTMLRKWTVVSVVLYVAMGWVVVVATKPLLSAVAPAGLLLLLLGGLAYTGGVIFYGLRRMPYHHAVWHLFVLAGSVLHFFAVLFYVIPIAGS